MFLDTYVTREIAFDADAVRALIEEAEFLSDLHDEVVLFLVKQEGVFLSFVNVFEPSHLGFIDCGSAREFDVFAKGCNPDKDEVASENADGIFGGDDFIEVIPAGFFDGLVETEDGDFVLTGKIAFDAVRGEDVFVLDVAETSARACVMSELRISGPLANVVRLDAGVVRPSSFADFIHDKALALALAEDDLDEEDLEEDLLDFLFSEEDLEEEDFEMA